MIKVRGSRRFSASSRLGTDASRSSAGRSNGCASPSRVRHVGSGSASSRARLFFSTTRPALSRPSSNDIHRSIDPGATTGRPGRSRLKNPPPRPKAFSAERPIPGKGGGKTGSLEHLSKVWLHESGRLDLLRELRQSGRDGGRGGCGGGRPHTAPGTSPASGVRVRRVALGGGPAETGRPNKDGPSSAADWGGSFRGFRSASASSDRFSC